LTFNEQSLFLLLVEILMYFVRQHLYRSKYFIAAEAISAQIARLLAAPQKHLKLSMYTLAGHKSLPLIHLQLR
jgi:protein phosphatase 4 regulatory subunit 3